LTGLCVCGILALQKLDKMRKHRECAPKRRRVRGAFCVLEERKGCDLRVILALTDRDYLARLAAYIREAEPGWQTAAYTQPSALMRMGGTGGKADLLVASPHFLQEAPAAREFARAAAALVERAGEGGGLPELLMYQPLPQLVGQMREWAGDGRQDGGRTAGGTFVLTFFSAAGGAGKTTLALHAARQAGERGYRVFYLNLETVNAASLWCGRGEPDALSRLLYALQTRPEQWKEQFERLRKYRPLLRADALDAPDRPEERLAMSPERLEALLQAIAGMARYDLLVVDPDSGATPWHRKLLERSGRTVWVTTDDPQSLAKTEQLVRYWREERPEAPAAVTFAVNKRHSGRPLRWPSETLGAEPTTLPYVPAWRTLDRADRLFESPAFAAAVDRLLDGIGFGQRGNFRGVGRPAAGGTG